MLMTPAQLSYTSSVPCAFAAGNSILFACASFIASFPNSAELRPQGCKVAIAPRARSGNPARNAPMTCGTGNMPCVIIIIQRDVVDAVGLRRLNGKVGCSSGVDLDIRWVFICGA